VGAAIHPLLADALCLDRPQPGTPGSPEPVWTYGVIGDAIRTLLPSLRLGFLVAPVSLQPGLHAAKQLTDWHNETVNQAALADFLDERLLARPRHVKKAMLSYERRRADSGHPAGQFSPPRWPWCRRSPGCGNQRMIVCGGQTE
jgi:hypothetical protein